MHLPVTAIKSSKTGLLKSGKFKATNAAPKAPIIICPSPPIFQNFSLKATDIPKEVMARGMALMIMLRIR
jgi:hypothetical protein